MPIDAAAVAAVAAKTTATAGLRQSPRVANGISRIKHRKAISDARSVSGLPLRISCTEDGDTLETLSRTAHELRRFLDTSDWQIVAFAYWRNPHVRIPDGLDLKHSHWEYIHRKPKRAPLRPVNFRHPIRNFVRRGSNRLMFDEFAMRTVFESINYRLDELYAKAITARGVNSPEDLMRHIEPVENAYAQACYNIKQSLGWPLVHASNTPEVCDRIAQWAKSRPRLPRDFLLDHLTPMVESLAGDNDGHWDANRAVKHIRKTALTRA